MPESMRCASIIVAVTVSVACPLEPVLPGPEGAVPDHCDGLMLARLDAPARDRLAWRWVDRDVREVFPAALEFEKSMTEAGRVRALPPIVDRASAAKARTLLREIVPQLVARRSEHAGSIVFGALVALDEAPDIESACMNLLV